MFFKKTDIIILFVTVVTAMVALFVYNYFTKQVQTKAEIYYNNALVETVDLVKGVDKTFSVSQAPQVVFQLHSDGTISFYQSDCPDHVCIKSGKLGQAGQSAACLPNSLVLKIVPIGKYKKDNVDIVIGH